MFDWLKKAFGDSEPERRRRREPEPEFRPAKLPPRRSEEAAPPTSPPGLRLMEFSKQDGPSKSYALGVVVALDDGRTIESECRHFKQAVLDYIQRRGDKCSAVTLTVVSPKPSHAHIREFVNRVVQEEVELAPILRSRSFSLDVIS